MKKNRAITFFRAKKKAIILLVVIIVSAWIFGQLAVPTLLKVIFL